MTFKQTLEQTLEAPMKYNPTPCKDVPVGCHFCHRIFFARTKSVYNHAKVCRDFSVVFEYIGFWKVTKPFRMPIFNYSLE